MEINLKKIYQYGAFCLMMLMPVMVVATPVYYGKHIVLVVDQTKKTAQGVDPKTGQTYLSQLGRDIKQFLDGDQPSSLISECEDFKFDPNKDCIEVFAYGLNGNTMYSPVQGDAGELYNEARNPSVSNDRLFEHTIQKLVMPIAKYDGLGDFDQFWEDEVTPAFNLQTAKGQPGYGLSAYMRYSVMPFIDTTIPAEEYYVMCVSKFQTSSTGQNAGSGDQDVLRQIYSSSDKAAKFDKWLNQLTNPYQISEFVHMSRGTGSTDPNDPNTGVSAVSTQLVMRSAAKTSVNITSNIDLAQQEFGGSTFDISPIVVSFPKDKRLSIGKAYMTVTDADGKQIYDDRQEIEYDDNRKEYVINLGAIKLDGFSNNDNLNFKLTFFTESKDTEMLPYVFTTNRLLQAGMVTMKPAPTYIYIITGVILLLILLASYLVYRKRGKKATTDISLNIWPISNSRFMDVTDNQVVSQDCWYFKPEVRQLNIEVSGTIEKRYAAFSKKYRLVSEYQIEDIDLNEDFSFRPDGREPNGALRQAKKWYPLAVDSEGNYIFEVTAYLEENVPAPDFANLKHCILRMKVAVRTYFVDASGKQVSDYHTVEEKYRFIVRPNIDDSDTWIALDPGTTGSCIAYGWGGLAGDTNNINLARSMSTDTAGNQKESPIFYSKVQIMDHASVFEGKNPAEMKVFDSDTGIGDYRFGNEAHIFWGANSFQSIKKLLGYSNELEVQNSKGVRAKISGHDLAHLLIKGLCREFEKFLMSSDTVKDDVRNRLLKNGNLSPSRAIVAVPNNYTVTKIQAMVDTVKRTRLFKEVHYLYEAEGVMMYYINHNWSRLLSVSDKTFIVFDMGGATINATAFRINVRTGNNEGNIYTRSIDVDTVSRVGYTVGGDNIDYALIKMIVGIPSMRKALKEASKSESAFLKENKKRLISFVQKLKLDYIEKMAGGKLRPGNIAASEEIFWTELFNLAESCSLMLPESMEAADRKYLTGNSPKDTMYNLVISSVHDALNELIRNNVGGDVVLIMSGRSVLYPRISEAVISTLTNAKLKVSQWDYNGTFSKNQEIVKTAVVRGACWYGMFSKYVKLMHDTVTSTFGYTDMVNQRVTFIPLIEKNIKFDENGESYGECRPKDPTINSIKFIQMLGSEYDKIYNNPDQLHKLADLAQVSSAQLQGNVKRIKMKVDTVGNFAYEIEVAGQASIKGKCSTIDADITDTNSEAYSFAALSSLDDKYKSDVTTTFRRPVRQTPRPVAEPSTTTTTNTTTTTSTNTEGRTKRF